MDSKKRKAIVYSIFVAAVIYGLYDLSGNSPVTMPPISEPSVHSEAEIPTAPARQIDIAKYSEAPWGSDPFVCNAAAASTDAPAESPSPQWNLGGILYDNTNPAAVINSRIVHRGELIDGARVIRIDKRSVILNSNGAEFSITLEKEKS